MESHITLSNLAEMDIGYLFEKASEDLELGGHALGVNLYGQPTRQHFDPKQLILPVIDLDNHVAPMTIMHPWHNLKKYHMAPGLIEIIDRKDAKVEAFSFGGSLEIKVNGQKTSCLLRSEAPILSIETLSNLHIGCLLSQEVMDLLAIRRAAYLNKESVFNQKLISVAPMTLFVSALKSIDAKFTKMRHEDSLHIEDCHKTVHQVLSRVLKKHPDMQRTPTFQDLL